MKPGDYPLGSERSRAAARKTLEQRQIGKGRITIICDLGEDADVTEPSFTPWTEGEKGFGRVAKIPNGMSVKEAERIFKENERKRQRKAKA